MEMQTIIPGFEAASPRRQGHWPFDAARRPVGSGVRRTDSIATAPVRVASALLTALCLLRRPVPGRVLVLRGASGWAVRALQGSGPAIALAGCSSGGLSARYVLRAIPFEERGLVQEHVGAYRDDQSQVKWRLVPGIW